MRALLVTLLSALFTQVCFSASLQHEILPGKYHARGRAVIVDSISQTEDDNAVLTLNYSIVPRLFIPMPARVRQGSIQVVVPEKFLTEDGYIELSEAKSADFKDARFSYLGRVNVSGFYDAYRVLIEPKSRAWKAVVIYHPSIPGVGWYSSEITVLTEGMAKNYVVQTRWSK